MKKIKITVVKKVWHADLSERYENSIEHPCDMEVGQEFLSADGQMPQGFCQSAWHNLFPYVFALSNGASEFFDGWMKNPHSAMISCNDGFRPVSFYLEVVE